MSTDNPNDGLPPSSVEAEQAVLGAVLINPEVLPLVRSLIAGLGDFYLIRHGWIYRAMCALDEAHSAIDLLTVSEELDRHSKLVEAGGPAYITRLINLTPNSLHAGEYARIVHHLAIRRRLLRHAEEVAGFALDESLDIETVLANAARGLESAGGGLLTESMIEAPELASGFYDLVLERWKSPGFPGIPSGFARLDLKLGGGFQPGELTLVAGFPGIGKSAFLASILLHASRNWHCALFTLEMGRWELMSRLMAHATGIDNQTLTSGKLNDGEDWPRFTSAIEDFTCLHLGLDDGAPLDMARLRAKCLQRRAQGKLDLVVVDYAGLLRGPGDSEYERHSYLSRELRLLAQETGCHILAAHQLNRKGHEYEKPGIHHLRGSGTWEQDANNVLLIYEPQDMRVSGEYLGRMVEIGKHRSGPTGSIEMLLHKSTLLYTERSPENERS